MDVETVPDAKTVIRRKFKELRRKFSERGDSHVAEQLSANVKRFLRDFQDVQACVYKAQPYEAPCLVEPVTEYFYPVMKGEELEFRRPGSPRSFQLNSFQIEEPVAEQSDLMDASLPAVVLCPAVAVDHHGVRVGQGKGFYDRFFDTHPHVLRVGVVFHIQFSNDPLPADSWDQKLDWVVSEKMILRTSTRSSLSWI